MNDQPVSLSLLCSSDGRIIKLLTCSLDHAENLQPGGHFIRLCRVDEVARALSFIQEINTRGMAYDCLLNIQLGEQASSLYFTGVKNAENLLISAVPEAHQVQALFDEILSINNEQTNALRSSAKDNFQNSLFYDEISRLNNDLVSAQRELAKKNAELQATNLRLEQAERALREYNLLLEQSNHDLEDFAYVASHDLQEPLRKVLMFSERLEKKYLGLLDETGLEYLHRMREASLRMQNLIRDLLSISRASTQSQTITRLDLSEIVHEVLADLETEIEKSSARVTIGSLPCLQGDATQMRQLMQNLIGNALKFHAPGQPPRVEVFSEHAQDGYVRVIVLDHGIGFDMQQLDRIFKPFQRLVDRASFEGSGMGLAICKRIVERQHGEITAVSQPGQGTRFEVSLPASAA